MAQENRKVLREKIGRGSFEEKKRGLGRKVRKTFEASRSREGYFLKLGKKIVKGGGGGAKRKATD